MPSCCRYRPNVAAVVVNGNGRMLACERSDIPGAWQIPQGGIDELETPEQALRRELFEEIGINAFDILWRLPETICYDWPAECCREPWGGQEQIYFVVHIAPDTKIDLRGSSPEFAATEWVTRDQFIERQAGFKRDAYVRALTLIHQQFPELI
jgi:putative (di)nucleoside polyphosphate hydrolase